MKGIIEFVSARTGAASTLLATAAIVAVVTVGCGGSESSLRAEGYGPTDSVDAAADERPSEGSGAPDGRGGTRSRDGATSSGRAAPSGTEARNGSRPSSGRSPTSAGGHSGGHAGDVVGGGATPDGSHPGAGGAGPTGVKPEPGPGGGGGAKTTDETGPSDSDKGDGRIPGLPEEDPSRTALRPAGPGVPVIIEELIALFTEIYSGLPKGGAEVMDETAAVLTRKFEAQEVAPAEIADHVAVLIQAAEEVSRTGSAEAYSRPDVRHSSAEVQAFRG